MAEKTSPLGEHFRLMESRISRQIEHITELRAVGQDTSEAIRKLQLLKTALNEMLTRYPPHGRRGWGPFVAHSRWGVNLFDYTAQRGGATVCALWIETRSAVSHAALIVT